MFAALAVSFFTQTACKKEAPVASFVANKTTATVKDTITFTNTSLNAQSYEWDFGDGNQSAAENAQHQYKKPGDYTVKLVAKGEGGTDEAIQILRIDIVLPLAGFFIASNDLLAPANLKFSNTSQDATHYEWDFGDGNTSAEENPEHVFDKIGTYAVTLKAVGEFGEATVTKTVSIGASIVPGVSVEGIAVGSTFLSIKNALGGQPFKHYTSVTSNGVVHLIDYSDLGLIFGFVNSSLLLHDNEATICIFAESPCKGGTEKGIVVGSSMADVKATYGSPVISNSNHTYSYPALGIDFYWGTGNTPVAVYWMFVYKKNGFQQETIYNQLVKMVSENK